MADSTLNKIIGLIESPDHNDLRQAAIRVAGVVAGGKEKGLVKALLGALDDEDVDVRNSAINALGRLQAEDALPRLVEYVRQGGAETEAAARAASLMGTKGPKAMGRVMHEAAPALRSRIAAVLARSGGQAALVVTAHALLDEDPKVVDAAARSLASEIPSYAPPQRHAVAKFLIESLQDKKAKHSGHTEAALVRVLGSLREPKAEEAFWARVAPPTSGEVRAAALHALGDLGVKITAARLPKLLAGAVDRDFQIVAGALMLLRKAPSNSQSVKHWLKLLEAPDVAARRFAVEKLRGVESKDAAKGLAAQISQPDRGLRDDALAALGAFAAGRQAILDKLLETVSIDEAWMLARVLAQSAKELPKATRSRLLEHAMKLHERDDRRAGPVFFLLRAIDHDWTRDRLLDKAQALRQKKKYAEALSYYRLLIQDPAASEETRFELAATGLKLCNHDLTVEARNNEHALHHFTRLLQNPEFDLIGHVSKAKWLDADDLFYLGFHFVEQMHRPHEFGKQVLELVVARTANSELGKQAKRKLKSAG
jgi:HEAT repeat protein